jgi:general secretion pathway protein E
MNGPEITDTQRLASELIGYRRASELGVYPIEYQNGVVRVGYAGTDPQIRRHLRLWTKKNVIVEDMTAVNVADGILRVFGAPKTLQTESAVEEIWRETISRASDLGAANILLEFTTDDQGKEIGRIRLDVDGEISVERHLDRMLYERLVNSVVQRSIHGEAINPQIGQRGKLAVNVDGREVNLRVSTYPVFHPSYDGLAKIVMRVLRRYELLPDLASLGLFPEQIDFLRNAISNPRCTILVGAPPAAGKSTTFYALLGLLDLAAKNIYAVEDPPEIYHPKITQTPIARGRGWDYNEALTELLRQAPDFVVVGEIIDAGVADLSMSANVRGVPLGSTIHADDALAIITALRNLGVTALTIAGGITALVSQRLASKICPSCRISAVPTSRAKHHLQRIGLDTDNLMLFQRGPGCDDCLDRGVIGRIGVFETVGVTRKMRQCIRQQDDDGLLVAARENGYLTMLEQALPLILDGTLGQESLERFPESDAHELAIPRVATHYFARVKAADIVARRVRQEAVA